MWPPKRPQISSPTDIATATVQTNPERLSGFEPIIALSTPVVPPEVPTKEGAAEGVAEGVPTASSVEEVRVEAQ